MQANETIIFKAAHEGWSSSLAFFFIAKGLYRNSTIFNYSTRSLAAKLGCSHQKVARHIKKLNKVGLIRRTGNNITFIKVAETHKCKLNIYKKDTLKQVEYKLKLSYLLLKMEHDCIEPKDVKVEYIAAALNVSSKSAGDLKRKFPDLGFKALRKSITDIEKRERQSLWYKKNRSKVNLDIRNKRANDEMFALSSRLRARVGEFFRLEREKKNIKTVEIIGASFDVVKKHIEQQFLKDMSWSNRGSWHIDHKIPLSSAKTKEELIRLFHYTNLQPLWATDNLRKGGRLGL